MKPLTSPSTAGVSSLRPCAARERSIIDRAPPPTNCRAVSEATGGRPSPAKHFVQLLAERVRTGLDVIGVATSEATRSDAERLGLPLTNLDETPQLDLTVDGADEIAHDLSLIKGGGGALLHEKIVASASARMIVIADESKWVSALGRFPLPVEVVPVGFGATRRAIEAAAAAVGCAGPALLRRAKDGHALVTDSAHWILDAALDRTAEPT